MKLKILLLSLLFLLLSGCSSIVSQQEVDGMKSCRALHHEKDELNIAIKKINPNEKKDVSSLHYGVVGAGTLASIPLLMTNSFYVLPALTITYYNIFIGYDKNQEKLEYLNSRKTIIDNLSRSKNCKKSY